MQQYLEQLALRLQPDAAAEPMKLRQLKTLIGSAFAYSVVGLVWLTILISQTRLSAIDLLPFGALVVAAVVVDLQTIVLPLRNRSGVDMPVNGTLGGILTMIAILLFGYTGLWVDVLAVVVSAVLRYVTGARIGAELFDKVSTIAQVIGITLGAKLLGVWVFFQLGGAVPFESVAVLDWLPIIAAHLTATVFTLLMIAPMIYSFNASIGQQAYFGPAMLQVGAGVVLLGLGDVPAALVPVLFYAEYGAGMFIFGVMGVIVVNYLALWLGRINLRSTTLARELAALEKLGETLMHQRTSDELEATLQHHLPQIFPFARYELRLFEHDGSPLLRGEPFPPELWEELYTLPEPYAQRPRPREHGEWLQTGDRLLLKISSADPNTPNVMIGGIILQRGRGGPKAFDSLQSVQALAGQIAAARYRDQIQAELLQSARNQHELEVASNVQRSFLPTSDAFRVLTGFELAYGLTPANHTSGDFYDIINLPNGHMALIVADVADKGTGAALFMALSRTLLRVYVNEYPDDPARVLAVCNTRILSDTRSEQFVTVFLGIMEPDGTLTYANAGHNPAFVLDSKAQPDVLKRTGIPLGMMPGREWKQGTVQVPPQACVVAYTDGVTEAQNASGDLYGEPRLLAVLDAHRGCTAADLHGYIMTDVQAFIANAPLADDITLLVLSRT